MKDVYCSKCGQKATLLHEKDRQWHQACPKRGSKQAPPEYQPRPTAA